MRLPLRTVSACLFVLLGACVGAATSETASEEVSGVTRPPKLPVAGSPAPWGGPDAGRWRPEAVIANAASAALNRSVESTTDVIVAIPTKLHASDLFPYGDGQSNAAPSFEGAPGGSRPPVIAALVLAQSAPPKIHFTFDRDLGSREERTIVVDVGSERFELEGARTAEGDLEVDWAPPAGLGLASASRNGVFAVRPRGWNDAFPGRGGRERIQSSKARPTAHVVAPTRSASD